MRLLLLFIHLGMSLVIDFNQVSCSYTSRNFKTPIVKSDSKYWELGDSNWESSFIARDYKKSEKKSQPTPEIRAWFILAVKVYHHFAQNSSLLAKVARTMLNLATSTDRYSELI